MATINPDLKAEMAWLARVNGNRNGAYDICHRDELPPAMETLIQRGYAAWRGFGGGVWLTARGRKRAQN